MALNGVDHGHDEPATPALRTNTGRMLEPGERVNRPWQYGDPFDADAIPTSTKAERAGLANPLAGLDVPTALAVLSRTPPAPGEPETTVQPPRPAAVIDAELRRDHLLMLADLPPTDHTRAALEQIDLQIEQEPDNRATLEYHRSGLLARLVLESERDALALSRPDGCWCYGAGGRDLAVQVPEIEGRPTTVTLPTGDPMTVAAFRTYCTCPEAEAARTQAKTDADAIREQWHQQRNERLVNAARIPPGYEGLSLQTFPDRVRAQQVERWYRLNLDRLARRREGAPRLPDDGHVKPGLLLFGRNRTGKTGLALGCILLALELRQPAVFRTLPDLLDELRSSYDPDNEWCHADLLAALKNVPLLVLDDVGAQRMTGWVAETIYVLLNHRMNEQLMTIFTSNFDPTKLAHYLGERIYWRVREPSHPVEMTQLLGEAQRIAATGDPFAE